MTRRSSPAALAAISYHQICVFLLLSIIWLTRDACVGGNTLGGIQRSGTHQQVDMQQILLSELLNEVNEDALYGELKKYQRQQPNYLSKWPGLRELLLTTDYGAETDDSSEDDAAFEAANVRFIERLRQLAVNTVDDTVDETRADVARPFVPPTPLVPLKKKPQKASVAIKDHGIKKNIQYMSPCHFKICNMGRKRNAQFYDD